MTKYRTIRGVYMIRNTTDNKVYVGSSIRVIHRCREHRRNLRNGVHTNSYLQNAWNTHGERSFRFVLLETCLPKDNLRAQEAFWMDQVYGSQDRSRGYNLCHAQNLSITEEGKAKLRTKMLQYYQDHPEFKQQLSRLGKLNSDRAVAMSVGRGKVWKRNVQIAAKKRWQLVSQRVKQSKARKQYCSTVQGRAAMKAAALARWSRQKAQA